MRVAFRFVLLLPLLLLHGCASSVYLMAERGDADAVRAYLAQGGDPDAVTNGWTALHAAAKNGRLDIATDLIASGAKIDSREASAGATALYVAATDSHPNMVKFLLDSGADIDALTRTGHTPLQVAVEKRCNPCATQLIARGANVNAGSGWLPLYNAVLKGDIDIARQLLAAGALVDFAYNGMTPLYVAAQNGNVEGMRMLIKAGASVNAREAAVGGTPLYAAAEKGHAEAVRILLEAGADVDAATSQGSTPLMRAVEMKATETVEHLLRAGADVNQRGGIGGDWSALLIASWIGDREMMARLYAAGADGSARKNNGRGVNEMFNRRELDRQAEEARMRAAEQQRLAAQKKKEEGGFQWGKMLALTAGAMAGGLDRMDAEIKMDVLSGIVQDSMEGNQGMAGMQGAVNKHTPVQGTQAKAGGNAGGSYPPRPNTLAGHPACAGYTVDNYQSHFQANSKGPDVQLHSLCAGAYNYYSMYLNAIRQGYSQADSDRTYQAFQGAAQTAINFYQTAR